MTKDPGMSTDFLTELLNPSHLIAELQAYIDRREPLLLLNMKVNKAPKVARLLQKDHLLAEERLLQVIMQKIWSSFPDTRIYRRGREAFLVLLPGSYDSHKDRISDFSGNHTPFQVFLAGYDYYPKIIVGSTELSPNIAESITRLEYSCDKASSASGSNYCHVEIHDKDAASNIALLKGLRDVRIALHKQSLGLFSQPIVEVNAERELPKFELLLREYKNGEAGSPGPILQKAEFNGVMPDIDGYVLELLASNFSTVFGIDGELIDSVSINISGVTYSSHKFIKSVLTIFGEHHIPNHKIVFEIKEDIANQDMATAIDTMHELKSLGFRLALDDIGVGSSNFKNMFKFPVDYFKIDRSYCEDINESDSVKKFVQIIIDEAHKQDKHTIAEGIPDMITLEVLKKMGIDYSQSFITGSPQQLIPAPDIGAY